MHDWKTELGWNDDLEAAMAPFAKKGLEPARVILVYRKQLKVLSMRGEHWARTGGRLIHKAASVGDLPAVGDWVAARIPPESGEGLVAAVLPRRTAFVRKVPGESLAPQVLSANIDTVLIVMGLDQDFNVRRMERFLSLAWESRATPVVVLNKSDLSTRVSEQLDEVRAIAGTAALHVVSALQNTGLDALKPLFGPGQTVALLGSSGVGKSTLVNHLMGREVMVTGEVRDDGRGRHTTTRRELIRLPTGAMVIDTPGLREVQLWEAEGGVQKTFDDIDAIGQGCRFSDCRHDAEPGCAVKVALADGTLASARYESFRSLNREVAWSQKPSSERGRPETNRRERSGSTQTPKPKR
jgi:ribosome biogenesis GTPase